MEGGFEECGHVIGVVGGSEGGFVFEEPDPLSGEVSRFGDEMAGLFAEVLWF